MFIEDPDFLPEPRDPEWPQILAWFETEVQSRRPEGTIIVIGSRP